MAMSLRHGLEDVVYATTVDFMRHLVNDGAYCRMEGSLGMKLTVRDAAQLLDVTDRTIYRWIKQGVIPAYQINDQYRFNRAELLEWATSRKISVSPEIYTEP